MPTMPDEYHASTGEDAALKRLLARAAEDDGEPIADFLLAWWNPQTCGNVVISELWGHDAQTTADFTTVFGLAIRSMSRPDSLGYESEFNALLKLRRPHLKDD